MHSSGMRTARLLTVSPSMHCAGGVCPGGRLCPEGLSTQGDVRPGGCLPLVGRVAASGPGGVSQHAMGQTPPVDRQTPVKT